MPPFHSPCLVHPPPRHPPRLQVGKGAAHTESAWAARLPQALSFLLGPWWEGDAAAHANELYFTSPTKLLAGQPATLFVNKAKSHSLAGSQSPLKARFGFNNWSVGVEEKGLAPAPLLGSGSGSGSGAEAPPSSQWQALSFTVPERAWEMQFVLTDGKGKWDNNAGEPAECEEMYGCAQAGTTEGSRQTGRGQAP